MNKIHILDESVSNIIAAGEVVENPASMIKEMVENSLDAEAKFIKIEVSNNGRDVKISDDGLGMSKNDLYLSIERHATSKIKTKEDIFNLRTYGFRGEALASIASVSKMKISSRIEENKIGYKLNIYAGVIRDVEEISKNIGTEIEIRDLFYNTPARRKFLRKPSTEYKKIKDIILREALVNNKVAFSLVLDNKESIKTSGNGPDNTILELFGKNVLKNLKSFEYGFLGGSEILRGSRDYIFTFINGRYVKSATLERAVVDGYYTKLMKGKYPFAIIFLEIDPHEIDVNVHPSKKIVKFSNDNKVYSQVKDSIKEFFYVEERSSWTPNVDILKKNIDYDVANKEEKIENLFEDEMIKGESQAFFSLETYKKPEKQELEVREEPINLEIRKENNKDYKIIGQLFNMYILVENGNDLEIYDQHIIHERTLYEELKEKHYKKEMESQNLLVPTKLELTKSDFDLCLENKEVFYDFGFEIEEFGEKDIIIRSVPVFDFREDIKEVFLKLLDDLKNDVEIKDLRERIIISMSCKGAIKAGQILSFDEMEKMIERLHEIGKYTCPHGRPIIIKIPKQDLDKMFGRI